MSGVEIALLRHFPTDWNQAGRMQGRVDRPLVADARAALAALRPPAPWAAARVLASPLRRAHDTAAALWPRVETDPRLVEQAYGAWEGGLREALIADPASGYADVETWGWTKTPPGGESPAMVWARVRPLLAEIAAGDAERVALATHRGLIRVVLAKAWGWDYDRAEPFRIRRGVMAVLRLAPDGAPQAVLPDARLEPQP